jgi:acetyl-CoA synthetase
LLLERGAKPNLPDDPPWATPLAWATRRNHADIAAVLRAHVAEQIGAIARPREIFVVNELPKTRSGKIMRRLLRDVAENREPGDSTTLADSSVMDLIQQNIGKAKPEDE